MPRDDPSKLILAKVGADKLRKKTGLEKFMEAMDKVFKPTDECRELEIDINYYVEMKRKQDEKVMDYVNRFEIAANFAKRYKMDLPTKVMGLKLLHNVGLSEQDMKLVLSNADFTQKEEVYKAAKLGLAKYKSGSSQVDTPVIKVEPVLTGKMEEALVCEGWSRQSGCRGYRGGRNHGLVSPCSNYNRGGSSGNYNPNNTHTDNSTDAKKTENPKRTRERSSGAHHARASDTCGLTAQTAGKT